MLNISPANADFIAELYQQYLQNPAAVDSSWASFFRELNDDARTLGLEVSGPSWRPKSAPTRFIGNEALVEQPAGKAAKAAAPAKTAPVAAAPAASPANSQAAARDSVRALMLIRAYRTLGHLQAQLDPLGLQQPQTVAELTPEFWGFTAADMPRSIYLDGVLGQQQATLSELVSRLQQIYCGTLAYEFTHVQRPAEKSWLQEQIEQPKAALSREQKKHALTRLTAAEGFEKFLQIKFTGTKRFGLEGGEAMIPALEAIIGRGAVLGLREAVLGMAHRGRLNVLTNVLGKPFTKMFAEFQGTPASPDSVQGSGDVKYHMGTSIDRDFGGRIVHLTMNPNPSHLEFVNPVVLGRVRAKQQQVANARKVTDDARRAVVGILIHGDAAFAGQGVVAESLMLSELRGYRTGGTIHFVINNQVGFTTSPNYARSGVYCSDIAKMIEAPIIHVNGDDVEAVLEAARLAVEYRQQFLRDVVIDMVCYRRHGHNEADEPAFTQPRMYAQIKAQPTTRERYATQLASEGSVAAGEADQINKDFMSKLEADFVAAKSYKPNKADWLEGKWAGLQPTSEDRDGKTAVPLDMLRQVGMALSQNPTGYNLNSKIVKQLEAKRQMIETGQGIDWATAEALAFGTLLLEGTPVRLSGQDCGRGTFSHRHSVLRDQDDERRYIPLNNIRTGQAEYEVHDSPLSECAVMGFDYGFSLADPNTLVAWEGQFGDFANGAQVIIDQFIASAETKWLRMSGLVLLLPHGYEGQGPEHSSARLERFLQLCAEDNMSVANCSTPANYYHILRRQQRRTFRKPLVLMTPKSLLRHKLCVSALAEMQSGTIFRRIIGDNAPNLQPDNAIKRVVLCSGKVFYDLWQMREDKKISNVALVRVEEFYPFPDALLAKELARYPNASIVWCQEEPENMGAWHFLDRRIEGVLRSIKHPAGRPLYVGRPAAASPATGSLKRHNEEQTKLCDEALTA